MRALFLLFLALMASGCAVQLPQGAPAAANDDPSLVKSQDGFYYLAFLSDRLGTADLWIARSADGQTWSDPALVATGSETDEVYPTLLEASTGEGVTTFHLSYGRTDRAFPYAGRIVYRRVTYTHATGAFSVAAEEAVTSGIIDDREPQMMGVGANDLRIFFSSAARSNKPQYNRDLYLVTSADGGDTWASPALLKTPSGASLSSGSEHDRFPWVAQTSPTGFHLVFQRHVTESIFDPTSDLFVATSCFGLFDNWCAGPHITSDPNDSIHDLFPSLQWIPSAQKWYVTWSSMQYPQESRAGIIGLPIDQLDQFPQAAADFSGQVKLGGWSARAAVGSAANKTRLVFVSNNSTPTPQLFTSAD
jgi:hypothetical protein